MVLLVSDRSSFGVKRACGLWCYGDIEGRRSAKRRSIDWRMGVVVLVQGVCVVVSANS